MPQIGLGTWKLNKDVAGTVLYALDQGYRMIDTSSDYGSHQGIGDALQRTDIDRKHIFLVTKVEEDDNAYQAVHEYLEELQQDYADLILIHRPPKTGAGEELWEGLIKAKEEGLALDIGVSNYSTEQIDKLIAATNEVPVVNQIEWSPFGFSQEMKRHCELNKIVIQAYSPLTRGHKLKHKTLAQIADKYGKFPAQILLRWNMQQGTIPLPKANQKSHLDENLDIFDFELDEDDLETLNKLNEGYSTFGGDLEYL